MSDAWLEASDVISVPLTEMDKFLASSHASAAQTGGRSNVNGDHDARVQANGEYQLVGQLSTLAGHLWLYGTDSLYRQDRDLQNRHPEKGDGGSDVGAYSSIDFKGTRMRRSQDPLSYHLLVREAEYHPGWTYILCLVEPEVEGQKGCTVQLVGWASADMLKDHLQDAGPFNGEGKVYSLPARKLRPLPPFRWSGREQLMREWRHAELVRAAVFSCGGWEK